MDNIPEEMLVHVLDFLSTQMVFTLMRVSHKWESACRYVILKRKNLILFSSDVVTWDELDEFRAHCGGRDFAIDLNGWDEERGNKLVVSLKQMKRLVHFVGIPSPAFLISISREIITKNSHSLVELWGSKLPDNGSVTYPRMREIACAIFHASSARLCPGLEKLFVKTKITSDPSVPIIPIKTLNSLWLNHEAVEVTGFSAFAKAHAATLITLSCPELILNEAITFTGVKRLICRSLPDFASFPALESLRVNRLSSSANFLNLPHSWITEVTLKFNLNNASDMDEIRNRIGKMVNLKKIRIIGNFRLSAEMFVSIHRLEEVVVRFVSFGPQSTFTDAGTFISSLVQNNSLISKLILRDVYVTDEDLIACAALANLQELTITNRGAGQKFTANGIRALLSGASTQNISYFRIKMSDDMYNEIAAEFPDLRRNE